MHLDSFTVQLSVYKISAMFILIYIETDYLKFPLSFHGFDYIANVYKQKYQQGKLC